MFTVKATYRTETRKFSFQFSVFPTFNELCHQLYRVFPISQDYYLSKLLFSPDSSNSARILIAKEVHSAVEYQSCLAALQVRVFPNPLLKFTVFDVNPHKTPGASPINPRITFTRARPSDSDPRLSDVTGGNVTSANVSIQTSSPPVSLYHIPPPPVLFNPFNSNMDVDHTNASPAITNTTIGPDRYQSAGPQLPDQTSCCSVSQAKSEIQFLMATFKNDIDRVINNTFGSSSSHSNVPRQPSSGMSPPAPCTLHGPIRRCMYCMSELRTSWFACKACFYKSCDACYNVNAAAHQSTLGITHFFSREICNHPNQCGGNTPSHASLPLYRSPAFSMCVPPPLPSNDSSSTLVNWPFVTFGPMAFPPGFVPMPSLPPTQTSTPSMFTPPPAFGGNPIPGAYTEEDALLQPPESSASNQRVRDGVIAQDEPAATPSMIPATTQPNLVTASDSTVRDLIYVCDACDGSIAGVRHKCLDCSNYDLCTACIESGGAERHNPFHEFFEIGEMRQMRTVFSGDGERVAETTRHASSEHSHSNASDNLGTNEVHHATCDLCDSRIIGLRYKCLGCPDFDTCASCFTITNEQHPNHSFVKIRGTEDYVSRSANATLVTHYATCDGCRKAIRGVRYKCMHQTCPDFDLCADCEAHPIPVHPTTHPFVKLRSPDTVIPTIQVSPPTVPVRPEPQVVIVRGRSPSPSSRPYSRGYLHNPSVQGSRSTSVTCLGSVLPHAPSPTYVPPHIGGYQCERTPSPPLTLAAEPPTPTMSRRCSPLRSRYRDYRGRRSMSRSPSPIYSPISRDSSRDSVKYRPRSPSIVCRFSRRSRSISPSRSHSPASEQPIVYHAGRHRSRSVIRTGYETPTTRPVESRPSRSRSPLQRILVPTRVVEVPDSPAKSPNDTEDRSETSKEPTQPIVEAPETLLVNLDDAIPIAAAAGQAQPASSSSSMSPQSQTSFKLPQLSLDPSADLFCEFWPRVAQELRHLLQEPSVAPDASQVANASQDANKQDGPANATSCSTDRAVEFQDVRSMPATGAEMSQVHDAPVLIHPPTSLELRAQPSLSSLFSSRESDNNGDSNNTRRPASVIQDLAAENSTEQRVKDQSPEIAPVEATAEPALSAMFLCHNTVPSGQVFPPGAEFVKSWRMANDGVRDWPETTELVFAAGDLMTRDDEEPQRVEVGTVTAGTEVNVWTGELKAPDAAGKYVGYWRLSDGNGNFFGQSIWIEISVVAASTQGDGSAEGSLASSSIVMPASAIGPLPRSNAELSSSMSSPVTAPIVPPSESADDSDSVSLISIPSSNDDDESAWEDSRSHVMVSARGMEYVVLYDSASEEE